MLKENGSKWVTCPDEGNRQGQRWKEHRDVIFVSGLAVEEPQAALATTLWILVERVSSRCPGVWGMG